MAAPSHLSREWSQPAYPPVFEGHRLPNSPPTPPPTTSTLSPPLHNLHHHTSSGSTRTAGILTPPSSPPKPQQQAQAQAQAQSHFQPHHKSSDSGVGLSSYPLKYTHTATTTTNELSKPYPLLSTIPLTPYRGSMSLCDLLDDVLDSMTEFSNPPLPPPPPPHPGTQVILGPSVQARPISLLRCTSVPVDDESLARYTKCARTFVRRIEGGIGMWGLNRFMTALRNGGGEIEGGNGSRGVCRVSSICTLLALRDGEDSYGASLAERLTSVKVDVRTLLEEVGIGLRELGAGVGDEQKEAVVVVKRDVGWERNKLERLAELVEMLLASLIPAIEECLVDGEKEEPGMRAFVPEGVVGRAGSSFTFEGGGGGAGEGAYYYHRPEDVGVRESTLSLEKTKREPASYSMITERSMATNTIWKRGSRTATPSPTDPPDRPQQPQRSTSFQIPPQPIRDRSQLPPSSTSSLRASSLRASYSRQHAESLTFKPHQLDRLSTITANTTATGDTFMYLARSMRVAAEVEGIREEELGIGSPGNWGGSEYDFDQGSGAQEGKKKWWRGGWGGKKKVARVKDKSVGGFDGGNKELAVAPAGPKKKGWKRFLCFGGEE